MTRMCRLVWLSMGITVTAAVSGNSANLVRVESGTFARGINYAEIRIFIVNDTPLSCIVVPLELRSTSGGAFVTAVSLSYSDRLSTYLTDYAVTNQYAVEDGTCDSTCGCIRGFKTIAAVTGTHPVAASPYGVYYVRARFSGASLPVGADISGSLVLTVNINSSEGSFTIDTTCINPSNHLLFIDAMARSVHPAFQKGTITVAGECCGQYTDGYTGNTNCDTEGRRNLSDVTRLIDRVYLTQRLLCCELNGNVNGDPADKVNLSDITALIDYVYISHHETAPCQ